jgi:hypothetical protein
MHACVPLTYVRRTLTHSKGVPNLENLVETVVLPLVFALAFFLFVHLFVHGVDRLVRLCTKRFR